MRDTLRISLSEVRTVASKLADPAFRHERAKKARAAQLTVDHYIAKLVEAAPPLTPDQVEQLRQLLPPGPPRSDRAAA